MTPKQRLEMAIQLIEHSMKQDREALACKVGSPNSLYINYLEGRISGLKTALLFLSEKDGDTHDPFID